MQSPFDPVSKGFLCFLGNLFNYLVVIPRGTQWSTIIMFRVNPRIIISTMWIKFSCYNVYEVICLFVKLNFSYILGYKYNIRN